MPVSNIQAPSSYAERILSSYGVLKGGAILGVITLGTGFIGGGVLLINHLWNKHKVNSKRSFFPPPIKVTSLPADSLAVKISALNPLAPPIPKPPSPVQDPLEKALDATPAFKGYQFGLPAGHPCKGAVLTGASLRPANFFLKALLQDPEPVTLPGVELFAVKKPFSEIRKLIEEKANQGETFSFSAKNEKGFVRVKGIHHDIGDFSSLYGDAVYRMSYQEIKETLESQKIYTSSLLPTVFYQGLKQAFTKDGIVVLPGHDSAPLLLKEFTENHVGAYLKQVKATPAAFGFSSPKELETLLNLTLYQVGAMVVKSEDFRIFMDGNGKILEREVGACDAIRLINACGIRGIHSPKTPQAINRFLMIQTFKTALVAAGSGMVVFPAVGMGVWGGDPDLYWRSFLDAVIEEGGSLEQIFINPEHQKTKKGQYAGCGGEEFQQILEEYIAAYRGNAEALVQLDKISNLFDVKKDVLQLAHQLKKAFPDKTISLFNASDPDVTLGFHVGEYVNNIEHATTTEENYTAMGTNGICFEGITDIHRKHCGENPRIFQVN